MLRSVPILFALSDISVIAWFDSLAAFLVFPPKELIIAAENDVTFSMYSFPDIPAVLYASAAYFFTRPADPLNSVSTPPSDCSSFAPSNIAVFNTFPIPAAIIAAFILLPNPFPSDVPALSISPPIDFLSIPPMPFADGITCTYAFPNSVAIYLSLLNLSLAASNSSAESNISVS